MGRRESGKKEEREGEREEQLLPRPCTFKAYEFLETLVLFQNEICDFPCTLLYFCKSLSRVVSMGVYILYRGVPPGIFQTQYEFHALF